MPVDSEMFGVMVTGRGNRVAEGTEQQVCKYLVYYITALSIVQITQKTSTNITRCLDRWYFVFQKTCLTGQLCVAMLLSLLRF